MLFHIKISQTITGRTGIGGCGRCVEISIVVLSAWKILLMVGVRGRLNWPQLHKLIWAESLKSEPFNACSCYSISPSPVLWDIWQYIAHFRQRRNSMTAWTGGLGTWARGGTSFLETWILFTANSWLSLTCRTKPRTMKKPKSSKFHSVSLSAVTHREWLSDNIYISNWAKLLLLDYSFFPLQCTGWSNRTRERVLETLLHILIQSWHLIFIFSIWFVV